MASHKLLAGALHQQTRFRGKPSAVVGFEFITSTLASSSPISTGPKVFMGNIADSSALDSACTVSNSLVVKITLCSFAVPQSLLKSDCQVLKPCEPPEAVILNKSAGYEAVRGGILQVSRHSEAFRRLFEAGVLHKSP